MMMVSCRKLNRMRMSCEVDIGEFWPDFLKVTLESLERCLGVIYWSCCAAYVFSKVQMCFLVILQVFWRVF